jgi:hypothetical protein
MLGTQANNSTQAFVLWVDGQIYKISTDKRLLIPPCLHSLGFNTRFMVASECAFYPWFRD